MSSSIGVFICDCQGLIDERVDLAAVAAAAEALEGVAFVDRAALLCGADELGAAVRRAQQADCERLLLAACSPRSSLRFPEERVAQVMRGLGLDPALCEIANLREGCAWQHPQRHAATRKAIDLLRMAHARLITDEPAPAAVSIPRRALVVGAGPAGLQTAKDLASAGVEVTLAERQRYIGGQLCQLHRIFQSEGWPSVCDSVCVGPVQAKAVELSERVERLAQTEVIKAERVDGRFRVLLRQAPRYVDPERCIACDKCAEVCTEETPRLFDGGMTRRKAIDKEFERALPDSYDIVMEACTRCGDCLPVCPTECIDLDATWTTRSEEYGAVFLATGTTPLDLSGYPELLGSHADVVSALDFERLMASGLKRPSDGEEPERVVFVQCAGSRAGPDKLTGGVPYCSKTCCNVTAKQVERVLAEHPMVEPTVVYYRDLRTYERALEELYQRLGLQGVEFVNGEVSEIAAGDDGAIKLSVDPLGCPEPDDDDAPAPKPMELEADLVVLAAAQTPSAGTARLYQQFGVQTDRHGFPVENQPRLFRPTESLVDRAFVVGGASGPKVVQQAAEQGSAAAMRALPPLLAGQVEPPRHASRVNPERCTGCRTCETVCPHGAIRMTAQGAVSDAAFCQSCGFCAAACPTHAVQLHSFTDEQLLAQARVAFGELPAGEPRVLALLCYWCAYSASDFSGIKRAALPDSYRALRIRCSSSVNTGLLMRMFQLGVDGILVAGCPEKSCHHLWGNFVADKRVELARALMGQLGLDQARLRFEYIGAPAYEKLGEVLRQMDGKLRTLGPNPAALGVTAPTPSAAASVEAR